MKPWGKPQERDVSWEKLLPKLTLKDLIEIQDSNQLTVHFEKPIAHDSCKSMSLSIASNAFIKSIRIMSFTIPLAFALNNFAPFK